MNLLLTRPAAMGAFDPVALDREIKALSPKVLSTTISHAYDPYAVFVHVADGEDLTPEERQAIEALVQAHGQG